MEFVQDLHLKHRSLVINQQIYFETIYIWLTLKDVHDGTYILGCQILKSGRLSRPAKMIENNIPRRKIARAYGTFLKFCVTKSVRKANKAHRRLSAQFGLIQPRGCSKVVPAEITSDKPAPTWIPFTTGVGIT